MRTRLGLAAEAQSAHMRDFIQVLLATAANKWFIGEDDLGSIEVGHHADLAVLDRDYFTVPEDEITRPQQI